MQPLSAGAPRSGEDSLPIIFPAQNLVLGCERLSTMRRRRSTQLAVLTQAPGRTASILGEY